MAILNEPSYRPRIADAKLELLLRAFGGVEILGPKWCGKTWTALAHAQSVDLLDDPATFEAAGNAPGLVLQGDRPHLVDEWQDVPAVWDAARRLIDQNAGRKGLLILTGSSRPKDFEKIHHSGAGRIARLRMSTMSLFESGDSTGKVSLAGLFNGNFEPARRRTEITEVARWCCRGGWPSDLEIEDQLAMLTAGEYIKSLCDITAPHMGLNPQTLRAFMRAVAMNTAQAPTFNTLAADMSEGESAKAPSMPTLSRYQGALSDLYLLEELPGWEPPLRSKARVRIKPKLYFCDPSLAASLLGVTPVILERDTQTLGNLFETLVMRDLHVYSTANPASEAHLAYFRDEKGRECDAILELPDGRWAAIEIKLSDLKVTDENVAKLLALRDKLCGNPASRVRQPSFLAFITGRGEIAFQRRDGVYVIPIATLGP